MEGHPDVPGGFAEDYFQAIRILPEIGTTEVLQAEAAEDVRAIRSVITIKKGLRVHGKILVNYSEDELIDIEFRF